MSEKTKELLAITDVPQSGLLYSPDSKEIENWQSMMLSCRKACHILGEEFKEPEFLDWTVGRLYHGALWGGVKGKRSRKRRKAR